MAVSCKRQRFSIKEDFFSKCDQIHRILWIVNLIVNFEQVNVNLFSIKNFFNKCDQIRRKLRFDHIYWRNP